MSTTVPAGREARVPASRNSPADRFLTAWKRVEHDLLAHWRPAHLGERDPDVAILLTWAEREHHVSPDVADFLHNCRLARNAWCVTGPKAPS